MSELGRPMIFFCWKIQQSDKMDKCEWSDMNESIS